MDETYEATNISSIQKAFQFVSMFFEPGFV